MSTVDTNAPIIWNYLVQKGFSEGATAGIMGNLEQESSLNPLESGGGLAQWQGERWNNLISYSKQNGLDYNSLNAQLGFLYKEVSSGTEGVTIGELNKMNPTQSADYFSNNFERPGVPMIQNREKYANDFYSKFQGTSKTYPTAEPMKWLSPDSGVTLAGVDGDLLGRLAKLGEDNNKKIEITSGFRSTAQQEKLYKDYLNGTGNLAAKPGTSNHEKGLAVDVGGWAVNISESTYNKYGLTKPVSGEAWHIEKLAGGVALSVGGSIGVGSGSGIESSIQSFFSKFKSNRNGSSFSDSTGAFSLFKQIDESSQFPEPDSQVITNPLAYAVENAKAFGTRTLIVIVGLVILLIGVSQVVKPVAEDIKEEVV